MNHEEKTKIANLLSSKGADRPCPRCGKSGFFLIDGYFTNTIQKDIKNVMVGGEGIPCVVVACTNCGFLAQHALGALGLLPESEIST